MEKLIWGRSEGPQAETGRRDLCKWGIQPDTMLSGEQAVLSFQQQELTVRKRDWSGWKRAGAELAVTERQTDRWPVFTSFWSIVEKMSGAGWDVQLLYVIIPHHLPCLAELKNFSWLSLCR